jgi:hypothetical protein
MRRRALFAACLGMLSVTGLVHGRFAMPTYVPLDRIIPNMEAFVKDHPNDPQGYYLLGRMHYLAFAAQLPLVPIFAYSSPGLPNVAPDYRISNEWLLADLRQEEAERLILDAWGYATTADVPPDKKAAFQEAVWLKEQELQKQGWKPAYFDAATALAHAAAAVDNFDRALDLDPENGLFYLGVASLYDQYLSYAADANITAPPASLAGVTIPRVRVMYYLAYRLSIEQDRTWTYKPIGGLGQLVSYEAGTAYLRLAEKEPSIADTNSVARIKADVAKMEKLPIGPITPIIFSTAAHASVLDLLDSATRVSFDLDGTGRKAQWPWIKPTTGLLVWDSLNEGQITSGRQLFGTATWWLLFPDGYAALDALDDNRDGTLSGSELRGIGVWFDKNANGCSDPGEVQPVTEFGVQAIQTKTTGSDHGMLMNAQGLVLKNGAVIPTYDWLASPVTQDP